MRLKIGAYLAAVVLVAACGSSDDSNSASGTDGGIADSSSLTDGGGEAAPSADAGPGGPTHTAASLAFADHDPGPGIVDGVVLIGKAADESDVKSYDLYWGANATSKLSAITTITKTGSDLSYALTASIPKDATYLLVFTSNASGEMLTAIGRPIVDNQSVYTDISAGQGANSGGSPSVVIDTINNKLLVATNDQEVGEKPGLFRCNLDGSACAYVDISAGQAALSGTAPSAVIDAVNQKLLVVTSNAANSVKPALFRCNLDGTSCSYTDISAGQGANCGGDPSAAIDTINHKLLVATDDAANSDKPGLFRCNLDGTSCTYIDISAGQAARSGITPVIVVDTVNQKLLVVTDDNPDPASTPGLFRCNLDGSSCVFVDISLGKTYCGYTPFALIDTINSKLLVTAGASDVSYGTPLFRCDLDGSNCSFINLTGTAAVFSRPTMVIDPMAEKLLGTGSFFSGEPALLRCNLDGTGCIASDISAGQGPHSGAVPIPMVDSTNKKLLAVTQDGANSEKPALFSMGL